MPEIILDTTTSISQFIGMKATSEELEELKKVVNIKTFDEWSRSYRRIIKGSKAVWINDIAYFKEDQTYDPFASKVRRSIRHSRPTERHEPKKPGDWGSVVEDGYGNAVGIRGYTQFNGGEYVATTEYSDGSSVVHCGGPCGPLYVDRNGDT